MKRNEMGEIDGHFTGSVGCKALCPPALGAAALQGRSCCEGSNSTVDAFCTYAKRITYRLLQRGPYVTVLSVTYL